MSSSLDAGHYAEKARKAKEEKCPKSKDKKHDYEQKGSWPSSWYECKHCRDTQYSK